MKGTFNSMKRGKNLEKNMEAKQGTNMETKQGMNWGTHRVTNRGVALRVAMICCLTAAAILLTSCNFGGATINVFNFGDYIDPDVLKDFTKETGIKVKYSTFIDSEDAYVKVTRGAANYDVVFLSDYMIERMIREGQAQKIDFSNMSEYENVGEKFRNLSYDPGNEYSVPYMWGTFGILYNTTMVDDEVNSWSILWDQKYSGQIFMYNIMRESFSVALRKLGFSSNDHSPASLEMAKAELLAQKPLVQTYVSDDGKDKMVGREGALAAVYNGDAMFGIMENDELDYVIPDEGGILWYDSMIIPTGAKNKTEAEQFINYLCQPEVAAANAEYVGYTIANMGAYELLPEDWRTDHVYWPTDEELERCEMFLDLGEFTTEYDRAWTDIFAQ